MIYASVHTATLRFQQKIDKVKNDVKGPCADFLGSEIKYKILKKDITKAKRAREKEMEEQGEQEPDQTEGDDQEPETKPRRKRGKTAPETASKSKAKTVNSKKDPASKKRKRAWRAGRGLTESHLCCRCLVGLNRKHYIADWDLTPNSCVETFEIMAMLLYSGAAAMPTGLQFSLYMDFDLHQCEQGFQFNTIDAMIGVYCSVNPRCWIWKLERWTYRGICFRRSVYTFKHRSKDKNVQRVSQGWCLFLDCYIYIYIYYIIYIYIIPQMWACHMMPNLLYMQCQVLPAKLGVWRGCTLVVQHGTKVFFPLVWMELAYIGLYPQNLWTSIRSMITNGFKKMVSQRFGVYGIIAQVPCTEIIQSAVADVADMAAISNDDPNKKCRVLCALSKVNLHKSATQANFRTNVSSLFWAMQHFLHGRVWTPILFVYISALFNQLLFPLINEMCKSRSLRRKALQRSWHPTAYAMRSTSPTTKLGISVTSLGSDRLHTWKPLWGQTNLTAFWVATHWNNQKKHWSCSGTGTKHSSHHSSCFKIQSSQPSCRTAYLYIYMETRELHTKKRGFW